MCGADVTVKPIGTEKICQTTITLNQMWKKQTRMMTLSHDGKN